MPKQVKARAAQDTQEERLVRGLAGSHHAPADWKFHAQMVVLSWAGKTPNEIAAELGCHPQTVRIHLKRFTLEGISGLGMRPGSGRKARLTQREYSRILALVKQAPPGHLSTQADGMMVAPDEAGSAQWTLNALAQAAKEADNATGDIFIITDNLSSHNSAQTRAWLAEHPRLHHVFIPTGAGSAQSARGLVASLPSRCPSGSEFCQS